MQYQHIKIFQILALSKQISWISLILTKIKIIISELSDMFCCLNGTSYVWSSLIVVSETPKTYTGKEGPPKFPRQKSEKKRLVKPR